MDSRPNSALHRRVTRRQVLGTGAAAGAASLAALATARGTAGAAPTSSFSAPYFRRQEAVKLTLYGWYLPSEPVFRKIADAFTQEHPNVTIDIIIPSDHMTQLKVEFAAGGGPDLTAMNTPSGIPWIRRGAFLSVQEQVQNDPEYAANLDALIPWAREAYTMDGELYGTPLTAESTCIYYNEDLVQQAGLPSFADIQDDPEQWNVDKLREYAAAINSGSDDSPDRIYGIHSLGPLQVGWGNDLYANGGEFLSPDGMTCNMGSEIAIQTIQHLMDLRYSDNVASPPDPFIEGQGIDSGATFQRGALGILSGGEWSIATYNGFNEGQGLPFNWNIARRPFSTITGKRTAVSHSVAMVANKNTQHPAEALEFVKFIAREDMQLLISTEGWGSLSAHPNTYEQWLSEDSAPANKRAITESHDDARGYPVCPVLETAEAQDALNSILHEQIFYNEMDVAEGLTEIQTLTNEAIQRAAANS